MLEDQTWCSQPPPSLKWIYDQSKIGFVYLAQHVFLSIHIKFCRFNVSHTPHGNLLLTSEHSPEVINHYGAFKLYTVLGYTNTRNRIQISLKISVSVTLMYPTVQLSEQHHRFRSLITTRDSVMEGCYCAVFNHTNTGNQIRHPPNSKSKHNTYQNNNAAKLRFWR